MTPVRMIAHCIFVFAALSALVPTFGWTASEEDIMEKIKILEMQIQELKAMKAQQNKTEEKALQCMTTVGNEKFCACLAQALPAEIGFEQYVHIMVASLDKSGNDRQKPVERGNVVALQASRDKCIQK
jgi:hypothetical protein